MKLTSTIIALATSITYALAAASPDELKIGMSFLFSLFFFMGWTTSQFRLGSKTSHPAHTTFSFFFLLFFKYCMILT